MDSVEGSSPGEDIQFINCFPSQERTEQSAQTQDVVKMSMCEEDAGEILKARSRLQDLALSPLSAVDQKTIFIMFDDLC